MTYTPLQQGQSASYGTSGQAVADFQTQLNTQNAGKSGWTPLLVDAMYGPKTQQASMFGKSQPVVTSDGSRKQFLGDSVELTKMLGNYGAGQQQTQPQDKTIDTVSDPYTQALDRIKSNSDAGTANLIATIQAKRANNANEVTKGYERYKSGLQLLGIQSGEIESSPEIVMGHIQQAENAKVGKLQELDREEATAMLEAKSAMDNKDFSLLKEKMSYVKDLKKERLNTLKDRYDELKAEKGIGEIQAEQIYGQLGSLNSSQKQQFLQGIADRFGIPVGAVVAGVAKVAKDKASTKTSSGGKVNISEFSTAMQGIAGEDGYIDPGAWIAARNQWQARNGSDSLFVSNFKRFLNPLSYAKAGFKATKGIEDAELL